MFGLGNKEKKTGGGNNFLEMAKGLGLGKIIPGIVKSYESKILKAIKDNTPEGERGYIKIKPNKGNDKVLPGTKAIYEIWNVDSKGKHTMVKHGFVADTVIKAMDDSQKDGTVENLDLDSINELTHEKE